MSSTPASVAAFPGPITGHITSFDGARIAFDLYDLRSRSLVLVIPGFWRERRHPSMVHLAGFLNERGYRAAVCDPRGHGDSEGVYGFSLHEHQDTAALARHFLDRLPIESITLIGLSYGGAIAISTAARHQLPIASLLLISPVADFNMISPRINPFTIHRHIALSLALRKPRFEWRLRRSVKLRAVDDIRDVHVPVSLIHVKNDWLVNHSHSMALYEHANEPKELHVMDIAGNHHADRIFIAASETVEPIIANFLARYTPV
jgi:pimeloyl-ACP methyl ester carboxylesterase